MVTHLGYLALSAFGVSQLQAELAVAAVLRDYLQLDADSVAARARRWQRPLADNVEEMWNVSFSMAVPPAREEELLGLLRDLLASVEANVASFSNALRDQLRLVGAGPSGQLSILLWVEGLSSQEPDPNNSAFITIVSLVSGLALAALVMLASYVLWRRWAIWEMWAPSRFHQLPKALSQKAPIARDLWQLEAERWDMAERVIRASQFPLASKWTGVWQWEGDEGKKEARFYTLSFSVGGQFSGFGKGAHGDFTVSGGALDAVKGMVKWREKDLKDLHCMECAGQWDLRGPLSSHSPHSPTRIEGIFSAYDITAVPKRVGQGCFTLTADAAGVPAVKGQATKPPKPVSDLV